MLIDKFDSLLTLGCSEEDRATGCLVITTMITIGLLTIPPMVLTVIAQVLPYLARLRRIGRDIVTLGINRNIST